MLPDIEPHEFHFYERAIGKVGGVDSVSVLTRALGTEHVAGGTAYVAAVVSEPGRIRHTAMGRLIFGPSSAVAIDTPFHWNRR